jgi:hypothetical protein
LLIEENEPFVINVEHRNAIVDTGGRITVQDVPFQEGDIVDVFIMRRSSQESEDAGTVESLRASSLVGLWSDRPNLPNSPDSARSLREQAQQRHD